MGLLDWLTDGSLGGGMPSTDPMGNAGGPGGAYPTPAPAPTAPMPPPQGFDGSAPSAPPSPPPVPPTGNPMGDAQGVNPTVGTPPPTPDPTPAAGPPDPPINPATSDIAGGMQGAGPGAPPVPLPAPRPAAPSAIPVAAAPTSGTIPPGPPTSLAPTNPGPSDTPYKLGDQTALGRALGIDPKSSAFNETLGGLGAGLTAAGNSKGKSPFQALASGAGATLEGGNKEAHAIEKDNIAYLNAAIAAQKAGDTKTYQENMVEYQKGKLALEQKTAANKDAAGTDPQTQYIKVQERLAKDPYIKTAQENLKAAQKNGNGPTDPAVIAAAANVQQVMKDREATHLAAVGLHPQTAAQIAQQPGMTQANPIDAAKQGITEQNFTQKVKPGQYYIDPKSKQLMIADKITGKGRKATAADKNSEDKIKSDLSDDSRAAGLAKEDDD